MSKRILLGIDTSISPATQQALYIVGEFVQTLAGTGTLSPMLRLVLLNVIPLPSVASPTTGMYVGQFQSLSVTPEQRDKAEETLRRARSVLQKLGITSGQIEALVRVGVPADEIAKVARELHVDFIVVGSRGNPLGERIRRFFVGSTSRKVLHIAPCPVMIVSPPRSYAPAPPAKSARPADLVKWYEESITSYLQEHTSALTVFTPLEVVEIFAPPGKKTARRKEIAAATLALEQLARNGVLCRHEVKGELRYIND